jgi:uncharacterized protein with ACT and thioredoxin-like domain
MNYVDIDNKRYLVRKMFSSERIKDVELLGEIKHLYQADTIILDNNNKMTILADSIKEAEILEEIINE